MDSMMKLPDDMFRLELIPYLSVDDVVKLDNACLNHKYRAQLMGKISGVILLGDKDVTCFFFICNDYKFIRCFIRIAL